MRNVEITGYGAYVPEETVEFDGQVRHRLVDGCGESQLTIAVKAANAALENAGLTINDIDLIVSASAVGIQPIPCTAALIHEQIAMGTSIPAMDINTTCTSFVSALDVVSYMVVAGRYEKVLIISSETASTGLNPNQKESFELFGDGAAAIVLTKAKDENTGIICSEQQTWSEGAHSTEIRGGLSGYPGYLYTGENKAEYQFDMKGVEILSMAAKKLPQMMEEFFKKHNITLDDIDMVIPHQASKALKMVMKRMEIPRDKYVDIVKDYGNMVSASIPYALIYALENGIVKKGDTVMLVGTAAGLTANAMVIRI